MQMLKDHLVQTKRMPTKQNISLREETINRLRAIKAAVEVWRCE